MTLSFTDVQTARQRIALHINPTPLLQSDTIDAMFQRKILFKYEGAQKTGSFKVRGALNALLALHEKGALPPHIVTVSSGNHAQATAYAGKLLGVAVTVFFPPNPIAKKLHNTQALGAQTHVATSRQQAEAMVQDAVAQGAFFLPPFNHPDIICGQGTSCLEALEQMQEQYNTLPQAVFATCGGGGWLAGTFLAARGIDSTIQVVGAEPELGNDAYLSYQQQKIVALSEAPNTIADGARTLKVGDINFEYLRQLDDFVTVPEAQIIACRALAEGCLNVPVEPTSAVALAGVGVWQQRNNTSDKPLLVLLSGSNVA